MLSIYSYVMLGLSRVSCWLVGWID